MSRSRVAMWVALALGAAAPASAIGASVTPAISPPAPAPATARLEGQFLLAGRVTVAKNIRDERVGQTITRTWTFTPGCPTGVCQTLGVVRRRAGGSDRLV